METYGLVTLDRPKAARMATWTNMEEVRPLSVRENQPDVTPFTPADVNVPWRENLFDAHKHLSCYSNVSDIRDARASDGQLFEGPRSKAKSDGRLYL